jgi:hypothetical protein
VYGYFSLTNYSFTKINSFRIRNLPEDGLFTGSILLYRARKKRKIGTMRRRFE